MVEDAAREVNRSLWFNVNDGVLCCDRNKWVLKWTGNEGGNKNWVLESVFASVERALISKASFASTRTRDPSEKKRIRRHVINVIKAFVYVMSRDTLPDIVPLHNEL